MRFIKLIIALIIVVDTAAHAQFSTNSQPDILTSTDYRNLPTHTWQFGITISHKSLSKLITGSEVLKDESRSRFTNGVSTRISYGISEKIALSSIINYNQKSFEIRLPSVGREYLKTRGLGDTYILGEYSPETWSLAEGKKLSFGAGVKIPTGKTSYSSNDINILNDMQPGTGTWDFLVWGSTIRRLKRDSPGYLYLKAGYRLNGQNNDIDYGNELFGSAGLMILPEYVGRFSAYVRYSKIGNYKDDSGKILQNTGSILISLVGDIKADITRKLFGRLALEIPTMRKVEGTQLGVEYIVNISFQYTMLD